MSEWLNVLTASTTAICGNGVVENGEECDCGWEDECREQCCYPQTASSDTASAAAAAAGRPCTRRHGAECRSLSNHVVILPFNGLVYPYDVLRFAVIIYT